MPDRVIRDELLESGRWLDLPSDTHRLIFENLLLIADDYGNFEGGPRRLFRWMHAFTQIKTETDSIKVMTDLQDADMVRRYEVNDREYWHIPRFKNSRKYWSRKFPTSPYQESGRVPSKEVDAENPHPILTPPSPHLPGGVGEGLEWKKNKEGADAPAEAGNRSNSLPARTPKDVIFTLGVTLLTAKGESDKSARGFLAKLAKGGNEKKLAELIVRMALDPKIEPKSYLAASMRENEEPHV